jgi:Phage tail tube protein
MSLAEGVSGVISYKAYASGAMTSNIQDQAPGATGAKTLRRVSSTLNLAKNTYSSNEIRADRQIYDFRHGTRHVQGDIAGELSPATYFDFFEAVHRDTRQAGISATATDFTSVTANAAESSFTFGAGDPVAKGLMIGDPIRFTVGLTGPNANKNFIITGFSGTNNETVLVSPAPADEAAVTTFTVVRPGLSTIVPATGHVSRKFGIEIYHQDIGASRLFTECRLSKYQLQLPATGLGTATFSAMGRDMTTSAAPYFTSPTPPTGTGIIAAVNGQLMAGGAQIGVVTGLNLTLDLSPSAAEVVGQNFPAEIFLGRANLTGQLTAYFEDTTLINDYVNESEIEMLFRLDTDSTPNTPTIVGYLPRLKLGSADLALQGEGGQVLTMNFQALKYEGSTPGKVNSTIRICDTEAA